MLLVQVPFSQDKDRAVYTFHIQHRIYHTSVVDIWTSRGPTVLTRWSYTAGGDNYKPRSTCYLRKEERQTVFINLI